MGSITSIHACLSSKMLAGACALALVCAMALPCQVPAHASEVAGNAPTPSTTEDFGTASLRASQGQTDGFLEAFSLSQREYNKVMDFAEQYESWPYVWGGKYPNQGGFDCSGLVTHVYNEVLDAGIDGWMTNAERIYKEYCTPVSAAQAKPGDIVFWTGTYGNDVNYISHVGIYCGDNLSYAAGGSGVGYYKINAITNIKGKPATFFFGEMTLGKKDELGSMSSSISSTGISMYRLYNRVSHEHLYTSDRNERNTLATGDWTYEGIGWTAPATGADVYRLYSPALGDHHYTTDKNERDTLVKNGWNYEGVAWKSGGSVPLYRQCHPTATVGAHNFTTSKNEHDTLVSRGWRAEGIAWYGLR